MRLYLTYQTLVVFCLQYFHIWKGFPKNIFETYLMCVLIIFQWVMDRSLMMLSVETVVSYGGRR